MPRVRMKLKELQSELQELANFENPKVELEQYATPPEIAAITLHTIQIEYGDLENRLVADLGCGCGMLSIGASLLGCGACVGFDIDSEALEMCVQNIKNATEENLHNIQLVQTDVTRTEPLDTRWHQKFDTVIMNPPFGTKENEGIDMQFLEVGLRLAKRAVYSMHKLSAVENLRRKISQLSTRVEMEVLREIKFNLAKTYRFHKHSSKDIEVVLIRFTHCKKKKTTPKSASASALMRISAKKKT